MSMSETPELCAKIEHKFWDALSDYVQRGGRLNGKTEAEREAAYQQERAAIKAQFGATPIAIYRKRDDGTYGVAGL